MLTFTNYHLRPNTAEADGGVVELGHKPKYWMKQNIESFDLMVYIKSKVIHSDWHINVCLMATHQKVWITNVILMIA